MFRFVCNRIKSVYKGPVLNWNGTVSHRIIFISGFIWCQIADPIYIYIHIYMGISLKGG